MTQEVIDMLPVRIKSVIFTMDPCIPLFYGANQDPQGDLEKHSIFKPVSKAEKSQKKYPQAFQKTQKLDPRNTKTQFLRNGFCNTFHTKTLFSELQLSIIPLENRCKKWPGNKLHKNTELNPSELKKLSKWGPQIKPNSLKTWAAKKRKAPLCWQCCRALVSPRWYSATKKGTENAS